MAQRKENKQLIGMAVPISANKDYITLWYLSTLVYISLLTPCPGLKYTTIATMSGRSKHVSSTKHGFTPFQIDNRDLLKKNQPNGKFRHSECQRLFLSPH